MTDVLEQYSMTAGRFQPDPKHTYQDDPRYRLSQQCLALLVGIVALGLPLVMIAGWWNGFFGLVSNVCFFDSVSHFYYAHFLGDILVSALAFIGAFLLAYRGENFYENIFATIAGFAAFGVGLLPTYGRGCEDAEFSVRLLAEVGVESKEKAVEVESTGALGEFFELFSNVQFYHFGSAAILFLFLAFYTIFIFTRVIDQQHVVNGHLTNAKFIRNCIYYASGSAIIIAIAALLIKSGFGKTWGWWNNYNLTFWFESLALWAFGISWMVKGRFLKPFKLLLDPRDTK